MSFLFRTSRVAGSEVILADTDIHKFVGELQKKHGAQRHQDDPMLNSGIALMYCIEHGLKSKEYFGKSLGKFVEAQNLLSGTTLGATYDAMPLLTLNTWAASTLLLGSEFFNFPGQVAYLQETKDQWDQLIRERLARGIEPTFSTRGAKVLRTFVEGIYAERGEDVGTLGVPDPSVWTDGSSGPSGTAPAHTDSPSGREVASPESVDPPPPYSAREETIEEQAETY